MKKLIFMLQFSNLGSIMETRDHLLNGVSPKDQRSRGNNLNFYKMKKIFVMLLIFIGLGFSVNAQDTIVIDTVQLGNINYALKILSITKNSDGTVDVKTTGYNVKKSCKFWQVQAGNETLNVQPSLNMYIISNGKKVYSNGYSIKDVRSSHEEDAIVFKFKTTIMPTEIVFFAGSDDTQKVAFDAKTKKPK